MQVIHFQKQLRRMAVHNRTYSNQIHNILQISAFNKICRWQNIMERKKRAVCEVYKEQKKRSKEVGFNTRVEKKSMVQNRKKKNKRNIDN
jgi:hypothetical protein